MWHETCGWTVNGGQNDRIKKPTREELLRNGCREEIEIDTTGTEHREEL